MNKMPSKDTIQDILNCFSALGEKKFRIGTSFEFYHCPLWKNSVMSPVLITNHKNMFSDLKKLEHDYKKPIQKSPYNFKNAYVNYLTLGKAPLSKKVRQSFKEKDWLYYESEDSLNLWRSIIQTDIPKNIQIRSGRYFDPDIYPYFLETMKENFSCSDDFMKHLNKMLRTIEENIITVLLMKNNKVIGAGLVAVKNGGAFLFCGSINKKHRNKKYWKVLASARQTLSAMKGAKVWITTTKVPQLLWRGDETYRISNFSAQEKSAKASLS